MYFKCRSIRLSFLPVRFTCTLVLANKITVVWRHPAFPSARFRNGVAGSRSRDWSLLNPHFHQLSTSCPGRGSSSPWRGWPTLTPPSLMHTSHRCSIWQKLHVFMDPLPLGSNFQHGRTCWLHTEHQQTLWFQIIDQSHPKCEDLHLENGNLNKLVCCFSFYFMKTYKWCVDFLSQQFSFFYECVEVADTLWCFLREQKDPQYLREKLSQKHSKEQFELSQKIEQDYSRFFTGIWRGRAHTWSVWKVKGHKVAPPSLLDGKMTHRWVDQFYLDI